MTTASSHFPMCGGDDEFIIPEDFDNLGAVGAYYGDFPQVADEQLIVMLHQYEKQYLL